MTLLEDPSVPAPAAEQVSDELRRDFPQLGAEAAIVAYRQETLVAFGVTGPIPPTELGVTLALAVLLDATVIRMMLVPSLLGMLGEKAWYVPAWLDRRLPQIDFSH